MPHSLEEKFFLETVDCSSQLDQIVLPMILEERFFIIVHQKGLVIYDLQQAREMGPESRAFSYTIRELEAEQQIKPVFSDYGQLIYHYDCRSKELYFLGKK